MAKNGETNFESLLEIAPNETNGEFKHRVNTMILKAFEMGADKANAESNIK